MKEKSPPDFLNEAFAEACRLTSDDMAKERDAFTGFIGQEYLSGRSRVGRLLTRLVLNCILRRPHPRDLALDLAKLYTKRIEDLPQTADPSVDALRRLYSIKRSFWQSAHDNPAMFPVYHALHNRDVVREGAAGPAPEISVLVITWNSRDLLAECLAAVPAACAPRMFEIVVVDNGSTDGTSEMLREKFPEVLAILNPTNLGVAPARNQALAAARGKVFVLLDDDTVPKAGSLATLAAVLEQHPDVGIVGARLESPEGELQLSCRKFHNGLTPLLRRFRSVAKSRRLREYLLADWDHAARREVDHVIGACQAFRRETWERLGPLDGRMFYGWEDTDYCVRARRAGLATLYVPEATVVHRERRLTRARPFGRNTLEFLKSMLIFFMKYPGGVFGRY